MKKHLYLTIMYTVVGLGGGWKLLSAILDYLYRPFLTVSDALMLISFFVLSVVFVHIGIAGALSTLSILIGRR